MIGSVFKVINYNEAAIKSGIIIVILSTILHCPQSVESAVSFLSPNAEYSETESQRCDDGTCIDADLICDGAVNCPDGSDETQARCQKIRCASFLFRCSYGACVAKKAKCNGKQDCADNSDELHKDCVKAPVVPNNCNGEFQCNDGSCVAHDDTCDGVANCPDKSDETLTLCSSRQCPKYAVRCAYGACISKKAKCDNKIDCVDGSDEDATLCGRTPSKTTKKPTTTTTTTTAPVTIPPPDLGSGQCALPDLPNRGKYVVENSNIGTTPGAPVPIYTFLKYTCPNGYNLSSSNPVYCQEDGTWSVVPDCFRQCTMPTSYTVDFTCSHSGSQILCGTKVPYGTVVNFDCKRNHFIGDFKYKLTCTESGSFDNPTPRCKPECGLEVSMGQAFAVNAINAKRGTFPWQVALYSGDAATSAWSQICGGTLISTHLFITAAHCVYDSNTEKAYAPSQFMAAVGKLYRNIVNDEDDALTYVQKSLIKSVHIPGTYGGDQQNQQSDIAILEVSQIFKLSDSVRPACLDLTNDGFNRLQLSHNTVGKVAGWGLTQEDGLPSEVLQTLNMPVIEYNTCKEELDKYQFRRYLTPDKICAGFLNGSALCRGDSGGGLVMPTVSVDKVERWYLRGVVSVGPSNQQKTSCRTNTYTAFTEVFKLKDFLLEKFNELNLFLT